MSGPRRPAQRATIDGRKILFYLLDPDHPKGGPKARFLARFGFTRGAPELLVKALMRHFENGDRVEVIDTEWGPRLHVGGPLWTPDGRAPMMRTVWQMTADGSGEAAFVTVKPLRKPKD